MGQTERTLEQRLGHLARRLEVVEGRLSALEQGRPQRAADDVAQSAAREESSEGVAAAAKAVNRFTWNHDGLDDTATPLPNATTDLAFQIEYSIEGGPLQYIDIPAGGYVNPTTVMEHVAPVQVLCQQVVVARMRADYRGVQSVWSAQTQDTAPACPVPGSPTNVTASVCRKTWPI